ncbi:unnamed protein product [Acanthoscelides obtectus]|uniref:EF-hand domain-containing protein n=3 Tax=Acanthoscelides obtectus TaxID=200917 RepID=A0A9P0K7I4_ACAOB|nr:unnamed protein product [Acanthoscelides obtectus]CAK1662544.1 Rhomboid-related protein 3 [Acanthoscelides obtectus]
MATGRNEPVTPESPGTVEVKNAYFNSIYEKFDKNHNGTLEEEELREMLKHDGKIQDMIVQSIFIDSDKNNDGHISHDEFIAMVQNEKFRDKFDKYINVYIKHVLPRRRKRGKYADANYEEQYKCWPLPFGMVLISILQITCFVADQYTEKGQESISSHLIYDPTKRLEMWRYLTYMFVHIGVEHLTVNLCVQLLLGIPLEMVHKWWRVVLVYLAGVLAGSLCSSVTDPDVNLAGGSGGVYAILTAHIATILMNWREMSFPCIQLFIYLTVIVGDLAMSIYQRCWLRRSNGVGYVAHLAGALAGVLVGIWVLKNFRPTKKETYLWWVAVFTFSVLMGAMIVLNFVYDTWLRK